MKRSDLAVIIRNAANVAEIQAALDKADDFKGKPKKAEAKDEAAFGKLKADLVKIIEAPGFEFIAPAPKKAEA